MDHEATIEKRLSDPLSLGVMEYGIGVEAMPNLAEPKREIA
jgi:hypothetical protein